MIDTGSLRANRYLRDILDQPAALRDTLQALAAMDTAPLELSASRLASGELRRIVLTGMGASYHALHPIYLDLLASGLSVQMIETSELLHSAPTLLEAATLIVAVSQSGQSIEIMQLLERAQGRIPLVAVTNSADNPLALQATARLITRAGPESSVSCKTYTAALAALAVLSPLLTGRSIEPVLTQLRPAPEAVTHYLERWEMHVEAAGEQLRGANYLILAGRGRSLAAAGTGGLIIKEAARFPAEAMSCAAFRHGPLEMAAPEMFVLVYEGDDHTAKLNAGLDRAVRAAGGRSALVRRASGPDVFALPSSAIAALPIFEILPAQMISLALALMHSHEPGLFTRAAKITVAE